MGKASLAKALDHFNGKICKTAKALGISRPTIYRKLKSFGLDPEKDEVTTYLSREHNSYKRINNSMSGLL